MSIPSDDQDRVMVLLSIERAAAAGDENADSFDLANLARVINNYISATWGEEGTKRLVREIGAKWGVLE